MEFQVMPDRLFGASVRINGRWLGVVEGQPLTFTLPDEGAFGVLVELTPLQSDPTGDAHPLGIARTIHVRDGEILEPNVMPDGWLHIRSRERRYEIHYIYPKTDALGQGAETLPVLLRTETADFDRDGRLDAVETYAASRSGHVRVRSAQGQILFQDVYPDNALRVEVADLTQDGRPDLLIFWRNGDLADPNGEDKMQLWEAQDGALSTFKGYTGIRRTGRSEVLVERRKSTPYRQLIECYRYSRKPEESAQFTLVKVEAQWLQRADTEEELLDAFLSLLELGDERGAEAYLARNVTLPEVAGVLGPFYAHDAGRLGEGRWRVEVYEWQVPGYYDRTRVFQLELLRRPDKISEWKIARATRK